VKYDLAKRLALTQASCLLRFLGGAGGTGARELSERLTCPAESLTGYEIANYLINYMLTNPVPLSHNHKDPRRQENNSYLNLREKINKQLIERTNTHSISTVSTM